MTYIRMDSYTHVVHQSETLELQTLYNSFFLYPINFVTYVHRPNIHTLQYINI